MSGKGIVTEVKTLKKVLFPLLASALILGVVSCAGLAVTETPSRPEAAAQIVAARDAALTYIRGHFEDAPAESLAWVEERATPEDVPGGATWQYTAEDWVVTVSYAVLPPEWTVYRVAVTNEAIGFQWEGRVNGSGRVPEAPESALAARDAALHYVVEEYGLQGLGSGLAWGEERLTPENIVGAETYEYTVGDWVVTISYPVVPLEQTVYQVSVVNQDTGFQWEGEVDAQGTVTQGVETSDVDTTSDEVSVESIEILILESFPVQVHVVAKGHLPDACIEIAEITQELRGNTFTVTINTVRLPDARCAPVAAPFEEVIPLEVWGLPAGTYSVHVNGVTGSFELEMDNVPPEE